jgi:hypothetical protein
MGTWRRDLSQLSPNIETAIGAVTTLIDHQRETNKCFSKMAAAFFNTSIVENAPFESSAFSQMNKTISVSLPIMESVTEQLYTDIYKPFQFLDVDTMKVFRGFLTDVQQRSVDSLKSRRKSEKYLRLHSTMVSEWISFRKTRHEMLIEKSLEFATNMAAEVRGKLCTLS